MKTGRNDPCPCGSGRKFKKCCALVAAPADAVVVAPAIAGEVVAPTEPTEPTERRRGGRDWVPLQHQVGELRPSRFGRKKAW